MTDGGRTTVMTLSCGFCASVECALAVHVHLAAPSLGLAVP